MPTRVIPTVSRHFQASRFAAVALALALLTGCATSTPVDDTSRQIGQWEAQQSQLDAMQTWTLAGKAGLRSPEENTSANLDWNQYPHYFRLLVSGPFGGGRTVLEGREGRFNLTNSKGRFEAESPEALMQEQLGWSLPVSALPFWVKGLPDDSRSFQLETDELGYPNHLMQDGWSIDYRDWERVESLWLPRRLVMQYDEVRITLVINQWQPDSQ